MKTILVAVSIVALAAPVICRAQNNVEEALHTLQTSLNRSERISALSFLREQKQLPVSMGFELGRLILSGGDEAGYAAEALPRIGNDAIPIIAKLLEDGYVDTHILCNSIQRLRMFTKADEEAFLKAIGPILERPDPRERITGFMALRAFHLKPANALSLAQKHLKESSIVSQICASVFIAKAAKDDDLFRAMQASQNLIVRYAGFWHAEHLRIELQRSLMHVAPPLKPEEIARRKEAEEMLTQLANEALDECLKSLTPQGHGRVQQMMVECLRFIYPRVEPRRASIAKSLRALQVNGASHFGQQINQWCDSLERANK